MKAPPIIRSAFHVARTDLMRSTASFAKEKAKRMMGNANPLTGAEIRKPGSSACPSCHRYHRPGSVCPNTKKSVPVEALFRSHGEHTIVRNGNGGNPYRNQAGAWAPTPGEDSQIATPAMMELEQLLPPQMPEPQPPQPAQPAEMQPGPTQAMPAPMPVAIQGPQGLLNQQPSGVPSAPSPQEQQQQLQDSSAFMQTQNQSYLDALRNWQAKYGGQ